MLQMAPSCRSQRRIDSHFVAYHLRVLVATLLVTAVPAVPPYAVMPEDAQLTPTSCYKLRDGSMMPIIGLGVYLSNPGAETYNSVKWALEAGYRLIDTAKVYSNEESVGKAIADSGVPRKELWVTTKLWDADHGYDAAIAALDRSLLKLGLDYLDLYLIHSPNTGKLVETWDALRAMQQKGKVKSIGVSNFGVEHIEALKAHGRILPAVNQIEMHPMVYQERLPVIEYCMKNGILVQAYGSLFAGKTQFMQRPEVTKVVAAHPGKSAAHVLLRWGMQMGFQIIPKSVKKDRIISNLEVLDFELSPEEMGLLSGMQGRLGSYWQPLAVPVDLGDTKRGHAEPEL